MKIKHIQVILLAIKTFILFNTFLCIWGNIFGVIGKFFKISIFNIIVTGQKRDMTELKLVWPVNMTGHRSKIILSPVYELNTYKFFHCRAKRAGSFGECLKVALHSVVV